jgi:hypothetical protein
MSSRAPIERRKTPSEQKSLTVMLDGNPTLQKLVATWPNAYRQGAKKHEQISTWAALAMLRDVEVADAWRALFENGFCRKDGTIDEFAAKYLETMVISRLPAAARRRPSKEAE